MLLLHASVKVYCCRKTMGFCNNCENYNSKLDKEIDRIMFIRHNQFWTKWTRIGTMGLNTKAIIMNRYCSSNAINGTRQYATIKVKETLEGINIIDVYNSRFFGMIFIILILGNHCTLKYLRLISCKHFLRVFFSEVNNYWT